VLNLCKSSVAEFVEFMLEYIPDETLITNTAHVQNKYKKTVIVLEDNQSDGDILLNDDDLDGVRECKEWLN